jgi:hypothetical protein
MTLRKLPHFADLMGFAAGGGETHKASISGLPRAKTRPSRIWAR